MFKRIEDIDESLAHPTFWTYLRLEILEVIVELFAVNKTIKRTDRKILNDCVLKRINGFYGDDLVTKASELELTANEKREIKNVLIFLELNEWIVEKNGVGDNKKIERDSLLTKDSIAMHHQGALYDEFWYDNFRINDPFLKFDTIRVFAAELEQSLPFNIHVLEQALKPLATKEFLTDFLKLGLIKIPVFNHENDFFYAPVSSRARMLLHVILRKMNNLNGVKSITSQFYDYEKKFTLRPRQAFHNGIEAVISHQLRFSLLPIPSSLPLINSIKGNTKPQAIIKRLNPEDKLNHDRSIEVEKTYVGDEVSTLLLADYDFGQDDELIGLNELTNWPYFAKLGLNKLRVQLRTHCYVDGVYKNRALKEDEVESSISNIIIEKIEQAYNKAKLRFHLTGESKLNSTQQALHTALKAAIKDLKNSFTVLDLAVERARYHLIEKGNTLDTFLNELSSVFLKGFVALDGPANIYHWEEEEIEFVINEHITTRPTNRELSYETRIKILKQLASVIRFSRERFHLFKNIALTVEDDTCRVRTPRNQIFTPSEFELLECKNNIVLIFAFYAGLRSSEIANLRLSDVEFARTGELNIYIRRSKTQAGKRVIPFHLIAPPNVVDIVRDKIHDRLLSYERHVSLNTKSNQLKKSQVYYLSSKIEQNAKPALNCVISARQELQREAGPAADLHLLRHSFASHFFMRWYAAKYPDFCDMLIDQEQWFYQEEGLASLRVFFLENPDQPLPMHNSTAMYHFMRVMGHATTNTLFQVYIHSFDAVLFHALQRVQQDKENQKLSGKVIKALIPNMSSSSSRAQLKSTKTKDLVELLEIDIDKLFSTSEVSS